MDGIGLRLLVFLLIVVAAEAAWSALRKRRIYNLRDSLANLAIAVGNNLIRPLSLGWKYAVFSWIEPFQAYTLPTATTPGRSSSGTACSAPTRRRSKRCATE